MNKAALHFSILYSIFLTLHFVAHAQTATVFGVVKDSLHKPLSGVSVGVYGKPIGSTTDEKGKYSLTVPANEKLKIIFSFTGLHRDSIMVELKENERREINKELKGRVREIGEVVIEDQSMKAINMTKINPKVVSVLPTP